MRNKLNELNTKIFNEIALHRMGCISSYACNMQVLEALEQRAKLMCFAK